MSYQVQEHIPYEGTIITYFSSIEEAVKYIKDHTSWGDLEHFELIKLSDDQPDLYEEVRKYNETI